MERLLWKDARLFPRSAYPIQTHVGGFLKKEGKLCPTNGRVHFARLLASPSAPVLPWGPSKGTIMDTSLYSVKLLTENI